MQHKLRHFKNLLKEPLSNNMTTSNGYNLLIILITDYPPMQLAIENHFVCIHISYNLHLTYRYCTLFTESILYPSLIYQWVTDNRWSLFGIIKLTKLYRKLSNLFVIIHQRCDTTPRTLCSYCFELMQTLLMNI